MAWTTVSDSNLAAGQAIRSVDIIAIKDNISAVANGDAGAPKIQTDALDSECVTSIKLATTSNEKDWVLSRIASASLGAVGTYAFCAIDQTQVDPGDTAAGSALRYASSHSGRNDSGTSLSGTWLCMGYTFNADYTDTGSDTGATLWLRIA